MKEKFKLSHLVLYAKGWYKKTDDIWEDLKKILVLDDYTPFTNGDVFSILINNFQKFNCRQSELREVLIGIHPLEGWKIGYYTKQSKGVNTKKELPDYDMPTATIYYILSCLRNFDNEQWNVVTPKYKLHPKPKNISTKKVIEMFNKKETI